MNIRALAKLLITASVASIAVGQSAHAFWFYQHHESAFDSNSMHVALGVAPGPNGGGLAVRCKGGQTELMYMVSGTGTTEEHVSLANETGAVKLKLRIDQGEVQTLSVISSLDEGNYVLLAQIDKGLAEQIRDAKNTIAATVALGTKMFWENSFAARGSTDVVGKVLALCAQDSATN